MQPTPPITSRELRKAVSQARRCDDESCVALVRACPAASIDGGNANGKTALMLAAQFRPTAAVVEELLRRGANVDATTRRGHTALIFAAGRGRDATILTLLHAGASAKVRTVTGDTALDMARGRASPEVVALLEHAEAADGPWRSFVDDADALAAQAEHAKTCAVCRAKLGIVDDASNELERREAALAAETAATSERCRTAEDAAALSRALVLSACAAAAASRPTPVRDASKRVLGPALVDAAARDAPTLLRACADGALGRALPTRDRRPIRLVLEALLGNCGGDAVTGGNTGAGDGAAATVEKGGALFEPAALVDFARADPQSYATALELYACGGLSDPACATELWKIALEALGRRLHAGEALGVYGVLAASRRRRKSEGGATVDSLVHARAWGVACLPGGDGLDAIDALAVTLGVGAKYCAAVGVGAPEPHLPVAKSAPVVAYASLPPLAPVPTSSVVWVGDAASLDAAGAAVAAASRVAVDTEWGESGDDDPAAPPALIQAAVGERVYLVDAMTLRGTDALGRFVERLLYGEGSLFGFAFEHDRVRLEALLPAAGGRPRRPVVDLQRAGHVGLRDACATWLDKSEQCSDWERRPLSRAQVAYAALDAAVLFALHDAMCA